MNLIESTRIALQSLKTNKLRSTLTMLGIIIGVATVIAMLSIGRGTQASIDAQVQSMGSNLLFVNPSAPTVAGVSKPGALTVGDAQALSGLPGVAGVAPQLDGAGHITYLKNSVEASVIGVTPNYPSVFNTTVADGTFLSASDNSLWSPVVVLGSQIAASLFGAASPVGKTVLIKGQIFRVIGVMAPTGGAGSINFDTQSYVPLATAISRLLGGAQIHGQHKVSFLTVKLTAHTPPSAAIPEMGRMLRDRHQLRGPDDFTIQSQQNILNAAHQITDILTIFLGGIAAISLFVGGIGIMNIMLVSVTERTREIGIRKAVGACRRDILTQFLTEAMILSVLGGLIGILSGVAVARVISGIQVSTATLQTVVDPQAVALAALFSLAVGLFFGSYPANRAAGLNPIDALRYE